MRDSLFYFFYYFHGAGLALFFRPLISGFRHPFYHPCFFALFYSILNWIGQAKELFFQRLITNHQLGLPFSFIFLSRI